MSVHLSQREVSEWIAGERGSADAAHVSGCPSCRSELDGLSRTLADFRMAVRETGEACSQAAPAAAAFERPGLRLTLVWRSLAVAGLTLAALLVVGPESPRSDRARPADAAADAALMQQVDADVSQAVPDSMEPLLQLLAADSSAQANKILER